MEPEIYAIIPPPPPPILPKDKEKTKEGGKKEPCPNEAHACAGPIIGDRH